MTSPSHESSLPNSNNHLSPLRMSTERNEDTVKEPLTPPSSAQRNKSIFLHSPGKSWLMRDYHQRVAQLRLAVVAKGKALETPCKPRLNSSSGSTPFSPLSTPTRGANSAVVQSALLRLSDALLSVHDYSSVSPTSATTGPSTPVMNNTVREDGTSTDEAIEAKHTPDGRFEPVDSNNNELGGSSDENMARCVAKLQEALVLLRKPATPRTPLSASNRHDDNGSGSGSGSAGRYSGSGSRRGHLSLSSPTNATGVSGSGSGSGSGNGAAMNGTTPARNLGMVLESVLEAPMSATSSNGDGSPSATISSPTQTTAAASGTSPAATPTGATHSMTASISPSATISPATNSNAATASTLNTLSGAIGQHDSPSSSRSNNNSTSNSGSNSSSSVETPNALGPYSSVSGARDVEAIAGVTAEALSPAATTLAAPPVALGATAPAESSLSPSASSLVLAGSVPASTLVALVSDDPQKQRQEQQQETPVPSSDAPAPTPEATSSQPTEEAALPEKYAKMVKMGVPLPAVHLKMAADGVSIPGDDSTSASKGGIGSSSSSSDSGNHADSRIDNNSKKKPKKKKPQQRPRVAWTAVNPKAASLDHKRSIWGVASPPGSPLPSNARKHAMKTGDRNNIDDATDATNPAVKSADGNTGDTRDGSNNAKDEHDSSRRSSGNNSSSGSSMNGHSGAGNNGMWKGSSAPLSLDDALRDLEQHWLKARSPDGKGSKKSLASKLASKDQEGGVNGKKKSAESKGKIAVIDPKRALNGSIALARAVRLLGPQGLKQLLLDLNDEPLLRALDPTSSTATLSSESTNDSGGSSSSPSSSSRSSSTGGGISSGGTAACEAVISAMVEFAPTSAEESKLQRFMDDQKREWKKAHAQLKSSGEGGVGKSGSGDGDASGVTTAHAKKSTMSPAAGGGGGSSSSGMGSVFAELTARKAKNQQQQSLMQQPEELPPNQRATNSSVGSSGGGGKGLMGSLFAELLASRKTDTNCENPDDADSKVSESLPQVEAEQEKVDKKETEKKIKVKTQEDNEAEEAFLAKVLSERLTEAEQYMCAVLSVPLRNERLAALAFKQQIDPGGVSSSSSRSSESNCSNSSSGSIGHGRAGALVQQAKALQSACIAVQKSARLKQLLQAVLLLGNRANGQHGRARKSSKEGEDEDDDDEDDEEGGRGASAITVESLLALSRVKSVSDRTTTLLHCLVEALAKTQPDLLNFAEDFSAPATIAARVSLAGLRDEAAILERSLKRAQALLLEEAPNQDRSICASFHSFCGWAKTQVEIASHDVELAQSEFRALMEYFLEPDPTMDPNRFFTALLTFASDVKAARAKVEKQLQQLSLQARKQASKDAKMQQQTSSTDLNAQREGSSEGIADTERTTTALSGSGNAVANARASLKKAPVVQRRPSLVTASKSLQELVACQAAYHERHF